MENGVQTKMSNHSLSTGIFTGKGSFAALESSERIDDLPVELKLSYTLDNPTLLEIWAQTNSTEVENKTVLIYISLSDFVPIMNKQKLVVTEDCLITLVGKDIIIDILDENSLQVKTALRFPLKSLSKVINRIIDGYPSVDEYVQAQMDSGLDFILDGSSLR